MAAIAAVEAFRLMGWQRTLADLKVVYAEMRLVYDRSEEDDLLDDDGNGILDVDELTPQELATRKLGLAMRTVKEPEKLQSAVGGLWSAYLAVLATLRLEFARVAALALGISEISNPDSDPNPDPNSDPNPDPNSDPNPNPNPSPNPSPNPNLARV